MSKLESSKVCTRCNAIKCLHEFHRDRYRKDGKRGVCKSCIKVRDAARNYTPNGETHKKCSRCDLLLPLSAFHKSRGGRFGRTPKCKDCTSAYQRSLSYSDDSITERKCRVCNKIKVILEFHRHKRGKGGYAGQCKECYAEYQAVYIRNPSNKQRIYESIKKYSKNPDNHKKIKARLAVASATRKGNMPLAKSLLCNKCGNSADEYHHWSYLKENHLDVIPLCRKCHKGEHARTNREKQKKE